jgi:hypothetical protein
MLPDLRREWYLGIYYENGINRHSTFSEESRDFYGSGPLRRRELDI